MKCTAQPLTDLNVVPNSALLISNTSRPDANAGKLLEDLPTSWEEANLTERRRLLSSMLDAVYVDAVEEKTIVAFQHGPVFRPVLRLAKTREGRR